MYSKWCPVQRSLLSFWKPYRAGDDPSPGMGTIETTPHTQIHYWTGDPNQTNGENMGNFYSAGEIPYFIVITRTSTECGTCGRKYQEASERISRILIGLIQSFSSGMRIKSWFE
ncbi:hypothetical protein BDE02_01G342500 [Populus trichocarpa]|nr:hypothetical protein BDE02_01G342500 [Populus trichocarpa]